MRLRPPAPFVLLDDAREGGASARLYHEPVETVAAHRSDEVRPALARLRAARGRGLHAVGFLSYEAGHALEPRLASLARPPGLPLLWFGLFEGFETVDVEALLPDPAGAWAGAPRPLIERSAYLAALARVQEAIAAGDIYQANLTFQCTVRHAGDPLALYAGLRRRARAGYGAVMFTGDDWLLSLSPELFFSLEGGRIATRPMKGTAARGADDAAVIAELRDDPKQRAENLMIVDLIRNDLSRVAAPGSVAAPELFAVETYPTVHQMVSSVTAMLAPGKDAIDLIEATFPSGSITGAPKIRAMEIIAEIETRPRGVYTGSLGRLDPGGDAAFNVAIRTLHLKPDGTSARLGLGSGIVADSQGSAEWRECLVKGEYVASAERRFDLIETMAFDPVDGFLMIDRHLARMKASAERFGFPFDRHSARNELQAATFRLRERARVRLMASPAGSLAVEVRPPSAHPSRPAEVSIAPLPVDPGDFRLRHKTSDRRFYSEACKAAGTFEVVFTDPEGFLTEGSFTNLFVERDGKLLTPPASRGLLPGVLRGALIDEGRAIEADLRPSDLEGGFLIGNAARGLLPARLVAL